MKHAALVLGLTILSLANLSVAQGRRPLTDAQRTRYASLNSTFRDAENARARARQLLDAGDPKAVGAFIAASDRFAAMTDHQEATQTEAELRFTQGNYVQVAKLLDWLPEAMKRGRYPDAPLWLAIAECHLDHAERALPLLAQWRAEEYCDSGRIITSDLPVEASQEARSIEATAWLILSFHREQEGRPSMDGYLTAQRLAPKNPAIAYLVMGAASLKGDFALARRNLPLTKTSKNPGIRGYQANFAAEIDRREAVVKAAKKAR